MSSKEHPVEMSLTVEEAKTLKSAMFPYPISTINRLQNRILELERENAQLAAALVAAREVLRNLHGWLPKTSEELWPMIEPVQGQIASALDGNSTTLRDLLAPTLAVLSECAERETRVGNLANGRVIEQEMARLRALCGEGGAK